VAEHQTDYEFATVDSKDILAERERSWEGFTQFVTWSLAIVGVVLVLMLIFLA
jgi:hypothetical protein